MHTDDDNTTNTNTNTPGKPASPMPATPAPRPRRQARVDELFGLSGGRGSGPAHISVFESDDEEDARATPKINPNYVFHDTHETRRVLYAVEHPDTPCWLVGPTGCGKTTLIEQICARARRPLTRINMDANLARSDFLGIWVFKEDQSMRFHYGPASTAIRDGHVLVLDEIDAADPGVLLLFQACLEGRPFKVLETDETFPLHPDFRLFATANTVGRGDETLLYRAAQVQNFAFLDRFRWVLPIAYPTVEEETRVLLSRLEGALDAETCEKLAKTAAEIRRAHENEDCEAPISTRTLLDMAHDMLTFGGGHEAAFRYCFLGRLPRRDRELCERLIHAVWGSAGKKTEEASALAGEPFTNSIGMEFVPIPAGKFWMGSADDDEAAYDDEKPRHEVTISRPFHLGKYPVTQAQWEAVMGENPSKFKGPDRPVETVSWEDAQEFIERLNAAEGHDRYRLPTEAEWEYACRAGSETDWSFGDDEEVEDHAWYKDNSGGETHPVGRKLPNAWGLYDMRGNVYEWAQDWHAEWYGDEAAVDPQGPKAGKVRVLRGGNWNCDAWECRAASRDSLRPDVYDSDSSHGFRLACSPGH